MKALLYALLSIFGGVAVAAQTPAPTANSATTPAPKPTANEISAVKGSNAFAVDLYGQVRTQPGNLFFSPESISTAFAMAYAGAQGQTATEMAKVFHFTLPSAQLHPAMGALLSGLNAQHQGYELHVADALWAQKDSNFLPAYLNLIQSNYGAAFQPVDFKTSADAVRTTINQWVEQQTNDKITNLIGPGALNATTRLVLTNAIYFKGTWLDPFNANLTDSEDFHLTSKQSIKTQMMNRNGSYSYYDGGTFQELELPYTGDQLAMVILLPKQTEGLPALEKAFTASAATTWIEKLAPVRKVILTMPRFSMTQEFELSGTLTKMGMPQAFTGSADFSGMDGKPDFAISAAIHKAYIDVNEQGTEAAAATAVVMYATAMQGPNNEPPPIYFTADHPFLFLIRATDTGAILFMGRVTDPTK